MQVVSNMSLLSRLFGGFSPKNPEPVEYEGFRIFPDPIKEAGGFRISARIEKDIDGAVCVHSMIRADTYSSAEVASEAAESKAKQLIDQQGEKIF